MDIFDVFVDMQATGTRIKELRKQSNMRVCELAEALGLESEQAIYKWQRGQCLPNVDNLVRLSIIFGCHIEDILMNNMEMEEDASPLLPFLGFGVLSEPFFNYVLNDICHYKIYNYWYRYSGIKVMEEMNGMDANVITGILATIVMVAVFVLLSGFLVMGSITMEIYDEKTKNEKKLIRYMGNVVLIIMSLVVCVSVWMRFDAMVCFAILVPMMTRSIEDALCSTTYIGKVMKYLLMLLFLTGFVLILAAFRYDGILENNMVKGMILIAVSAVPFKAFVDMFNTDDTEDSESSEN